MQHADPSVDDSVIAYVDATLARLGASVTPAILAVDAGRSMRDPEVRSAFEAQLVALAGDLEAAGTPDCGSAHDRNVVVMISPSATKEGVALELGRRVSVLGATGVAVARRADDAGTLVRAALDALSIARAAGDRRAVLAVR